MLQVTLYKLIELASQIAYFALLIRVVLSWIPHDPHHQLISLIYQLTEPLLKPFRDIIPTYRIGIDLSPLFAFIAIGIIKSLLIKTLFW